MKFGRFLSIAGGLSIALATAPLANAASIVTNGTFGSGSTASLSGWTTTGTGTTPGIGITAITFTPSDTGYGDTIPDINGTNTGAYFVDDNANPETLSQTIVLGADQSYQLSFDLFKTASGASNPNGFTLYDSVGAAIASITNSDLTTGVWTSETLDFVTGAAGDYTLSYDFYSGAEPAQDVVLTDVAVNATPEPSSLMLLGTGILGAAGLVRRRFSH